MSGDEICLTLPADEAFHGVAHLVLGGLAVRLDLTYENLQDLELALDALLERLSEDGDVTVLVRVGDGFAISPEAYGRAREVLVDGITLAQFRDALGVGRKTAQLYLERFDADGVTRRVGDARVLRRRR